jgi:hypothetical protein
VNGFPDWKSDGIYRVMAMIDVQSGEQAEATKDDEKTQPRRLCDGADANLASPAAPEITKASDVIGV